MSSNRRKIRLSNLRAEQTQDAIDILDGARIDMDTVVRLARLNATIANPSQRRECFWKDGPAREGEWPCRVVVTPCLLAGEREMIALEILFTKGHLEGYNLETCMRHSPHELGVPTDTATVQMMGIKPVLIIPVISGWELLGFKVQNSISNSRMSDLALAADARHDY